MTTYVERLEASGALLENSAEVGRMSHWYTRPVLFVSNIERSTEFYVSQLGFTESWRHEEEGAALIAQVDRDEGCELILSSQWPDKVGSALMFISLDVSVLLALRSDLEKKGVSLRDGWWGYDTMIVSDPDGNELYFPYPKDFERSGKAGSR